MTMMIIEIPHPIRIFIEIGDESGAAKSEIVGTSSVAGIYAGTYCLHEDNAIPNIAIITNRYFFIVQNL